MPRKRTTAALLLLACAAGFAAILLSDGGPAGDLPGPATRPPQAAAPRAQFTAPSLYPVFSPSRHHYVARCGSGLLPVSVVAGRGTRVEVGGAGAPRSGRFVADAPVRAGQDFEMVASRGPRRESYEVRCLPAGFPGWAYQRLGDPPPGLFTVSVKGKRGDPWVIVFDQAGTPRWWTRPATRTLWSQILGDGTVAWARAFGDGYGLDPRMAHEVHSLSGGPARLVRTEGTITDGHEFQQLPDGNLLLDSFRPQTGLDLARYAAPRGGQRGLADASVVTAEIQEVDSAGEVVWRWNSLRHISLDETGRWWRNVLIQPSSRSRRHPYLRRGPHQRDRALRARPADHLDPPHRRDLLHRALNRPHPLEVGRHANPGVAEDPCRSLPGGTALRRTPRRPRRRRRRAQRLRRRHPSTSAAAACALPPRSEEADRDLPRPVHRPRDHRQPLLRVGQADGRRLARRLGGQPCAHRLRGRRADRLQAAPANLLLPGDTGASWCCSQRGASTARSSSRRAARPRPEPLSLRFHLNRAATGYPAKQLGTLLCRVPICLGVHSGRQAQSP